MYFAKVTNPDGHVYVIAFNDEISQPITVFDRLSIYQLVREYGFEEFEKIKQEMEAS